jgi:hypothetical protein
MRNNMASNPVISVHGTRLRLPVIGSRGSFAGAMPCQLVRLDPDSWDGLLGLRFVYSMNESSNANGKWTNAEQGV